MKKIVRLLRVFRETTFTCPYCGHRWKVTSPPTRCPACSHSLP